MKGSILMLFIGVFFLLPYQSFCQNSWEIDKDKKGIKVYTRIEKGSDFKSFKAIMKVNAAAEEVIEILKNAGDYTKWYGYTKTSKLLKQEKSLQYNYVETIFPWPYRNRDMVYQMSINTLSSGTIKISLKGIPDYIPKKRGIVRMRKAEGYILLKSSSNSLEIIYIFHSEPGDNIPPWLANNSIGELPFKTLSGLKEILKKK